MGFFSKLFSSEETNKDNVERNNDSGSVVSVEAIQSILNNIFSKDECEPLLAEAILEIVCYQLGSESLLQRSFSIGYNQSKKIMEQMELVGIVGETKGDKPRELLVQGEKEILPRLKLAVEIHSRYKNINPEEARENVRRDFEIILSGISNEPKVVTEVTYKELDEETLENLSIDENGFINYPNGVKLRHVDGAIYYDSIIYETTSKLGYNNGELYFSNHTDEGYIEKDYKQAKCIAYWELFTDKLICIVRNDSKKINYEFMRNCLKEVKNYFRSDALFFRLKNGAKGRNVSRNFLEHVLNTSINIPNTIDKNRIVDALRLSGIEINMIKEIIEKNETSYELMTFGFGEDTLYNMIDIHKCDIEVALSLPSITIRRQSPTVVRIGFANYPVNVGKYDFIFGGENYMWLTDCLYDGYNMLTLTELIDNDDCYRYMYENDYMFDDNEKRIINHQAECFSKIDKDILNSKISIKKFSERYGYDYDRINYIAIAAFYKQCDVLQDIFIESTHGDYEIISKSVTNGGLITKIRAYHELFEFVNGHSMPEEVIGNAIVVNGEEYSGSSEGYIYVMINSSIEGQVKIGKTTRDPYERAKELSSATGVPTPFVVVFYKPFKDCHLAEKMIHKFLEQKGCRVNNNREFFNISTTEAIDVIQSMYNIEQENS
mgnify:CR=1 FL=1